MKSKKCLKYFFSYFLIILSVFELEASQPNFIIIFADDLGYGDLSCYGSKTNNTINLDRMAKEGIMHTDFYATSSVCSPSRASILTGRYPSRAGYPYASGGVYSDLGLQKSEVTIAEALKSKGYNTAFVGKHHLGIPQGFDYQTQEGFNDKSEFHPLNQGFDEFFGVAGNPHPDGSFIVQEGNNVKYRDKHYIQLTDLYLEWVQNYLKKESSPFFIYIAQDLVHAPWMVHPRFSGTSKAGTYGDMVHHLDWFVGELLNTLEKEGLSDNTLVVFTSDNGAGGNVGGSNAPFRGQKGTTWEGGMRVPGIFWWPGVLPSQKVISGEINTIMDLFPTFVALADANIDNNTVIDGKNIWPLLTGNKSDYDPYDSFYYYNGLNLQAVRVDEWKLILPRREEMLVWWESGLRELDKPMLIDLSKDKSESVDLSSQYPEIVSQLLNKATEARRDLGSWNKKGIYQKSIDHLLDDRVGLRHLRKQQNHINMGKKRHED